MKNGTIPNIHMHSINSMRILYLCNAFSLPFPFAFGFRIITTENIWCVAISIAIYVMSTFDNYSNIFRSQSHERRECVFGLDIKTDTASCWLVNNFIFRRWKRSFLFTTKVPKLLSRLFLSASFPWDFLELFICSHTARSIVATFLRSILSEVFGIGLFCQIGWNTYTENVAKCGDFQSKRCALAVCVCHFNQSYGWLRFNRYCRAAERGLVSSMLFFSTLLFKCFAPTIIKLYDSVFFVPSGKHMRANSFLFFHVCIRFGIDFNWKSTHWLLWNGNASALDSGRISTKKVRRRSGSEHSQANRKRPQCSSRRNVQTQGNSLRNKHTHIPRIDVRLSREWQLSIVYDVD